MCVEMDDLLTKISSLGRVQIEFTRFGCAVGSLHFCPANQKVFSWLGMYTKLPMLGGVVGVRREALRIMPKLKIMPNR